MYELVYSSHRAVAQAAGEFLNERLFINDEGNDPDIRTKRGKKRLENTPRIRDLVSKRIDQIILIGGLGLLSPSSTLIVFSSSRFFQGKVTNRKLR